MGTYIMVRAYGEHAQDGVEAAFARAKELEQVFSNTIADSEVNQVNTAAKAAVGTDILISADMANVLRAALEYGEKSGGMLDCTIGDLIDLWGIGGGQDPCTAAAGRLEGCQLSCGQPVPFLCQRRSYAELRRCGKGVYFR